jgi:hypothetical protein
MKKYNRIYLYYKNLYQCRSFNFETTHQIDVVFDQGFWQIMCKLRNEALYYEEV